jgi:hypothetical protein
VGCTSCHAVHGANTFNGGTYILKNDPGLNGGALASPVTNYTDFCRDCHNASGNNVGVGSCFDSICHTPGGSGGIDISTDYWSEARNGITHIMTTTLSGNYGTKVAWTSSEECYRCHSAGNPTGGAPFTEGDSFPHYTPSAVQFLPDYTTENTGMDAACLNCHVEGGDGDSYTTGVGKTF